MLGSGMLSLKAIAGGSSSVSGLGKLGLRPLLGGSGSGSVRPRSGLSLLGDRRSWRHRAALYGRRILGVLQEGDVDEGETAASDAAARRGEAI